MCNYKMAAVGGGLDFIFTALTILLCFGGMQFTVFGTRRRVFHTFSTVCVIWKGAAYHFHSLG